MNEARISTPGVIATALFWGALGWGLLLAALLYESFDSWEEDGERLLNCLAILGPGYLVTLGYGLRMVTFPWWFVRQGIWSISIVVQGAWLLIWWISTNQAEGLDLPSLWWLFATVASLIALLTEPLKAPWKVYEQELPAQA